MSNRYVYAGFWLRALASLIDTVLMLLITAPVLIAYYGFDVYWQSAENGELLGLVDLLMSWILPLLLTIWFWVRFEATPGKMLLCLKILDEKTGNPLTLQQSMLRYAGYFVSALGLMLGFVSIAFNTKKQGWHDKIARTVVVRDRGLDM